MSQTTQNRSTYPTADAAARYQDLAGKVVVITGASRGIGAETARFFALNGARVLVAGRDQAALDEVVASVEELGGEAVAFARDCRDAAGLAEMKERVESRLGPVDILIVNAGGQGEPQPSDSLSEETWREVVDLNLTAKFLAIQTFLPGMRERGKGSVVLMSSIAGRQASQANIAYACAEAGTNMLTKHLANEYGAAGVRFNCVMPSSVRNQRMSAMGPDKIAEIGKYFPLGRIGEPLDIAQAIGFLASEASAWITGATLDITGGRVISY